MRKLPTELKEQQGTLEKSRLNPNEVTYSRCEGVPDPPESLDRFGEAVWYVSAGELYDRGLLFKTDLPGLENYCVAASIARMAAIEIHKGQEGSVRTRINNWFRVWKDSAMVMDKIGSNFGFSPVDKSNISIPAVLNRKSLFK